MLLWGKKQFRVTQIPDLALWLDGTNPANGAIPADGASIATWVDLSGNGNNATQSTGAQQPLFVASGINGRGSLNFAVQSMSIADTVALRPGAAGVTIFIVARSDVNSNVSHNLLRKWGGVGNYSWLLNVEDASAPNSLSFGISSDGTATAFVEGVKPPVGSQFLMTYVGKASTSSNSQFLLNNTSIATSASALFASTADISINESTADINDTIGEIIVYMRELSAAETAQVTNYLVNKWDIPDYSLNVTTNLKFWLDAVDPTGAGTPPANDTAISSWTDKSRNNNTPLQGTGSLQPLYKTNILNGNPIVRFDGTNDFLQKSIGSDLGSTVTVFVVGTTNGNSGGNGAFIDYCNGTATNTGFNLLNDTRLIAGFYDGSLDQLTYTQALPLTAILHSYNTGTNAFLFKNGTQIATGATGNITGSPTYYIVGSLFGAGGYYLNGDIAEILMYSGQLDSTQIDSVKTYLSSKWGITVS